MEVKLSQSDIDRFFQKIRKTDSCWLWTGALYGAGRYGQFWAKGDMHLAHRISWMIHFQEIPKGFFVCHKCDVKQCVNPDHLFVGSPADNIDDMVRKKRCNPPIGERSGTAKLTTAQVLEIRRKYAGGNVTQKELGILYGVADTAICRIITGRRWAHI
jgi:hypothetical protein